MTVNTITRNEKISYAEVFKGLKNKEIKKYQEKNTDVEYAKKSLTRSQFQNRKLYSDILIF